MLGIALVFPALPLLIGEFTASREVQSYWFGALTVGYGLLQFGCAPLLGALSDRHGRRPVLLGALLGSSLHYLLLALAPSLPVLLLARVIGAITGASFAVATAYVSDGTRPADRARSFGQLGAALGLGFIAGPLLGGALGHFDLRAPFGAAAGLAFRHSVLRRGGVARDRLEPRPPPPSVRRGGNRRGAARPGARRARSDQRSPERAGHFFPPRGRRSRSGGGTSGSLQ